MAGSIITLATASTMTGDFRKSFPNANLGMYYTSDVYNDIMSQSGCVGVKIYFGVDENSVLVTVLVGVDGKVDDMINGKIYEKGWPIPPSNNLSNPFEI